MTCREKLKLDHPDYVSDEYFGGCFDCPPTYGYLDPPDYCGSDDLDRCVCCWNREIPEPIETIKMADELAAMRDALMSKGFTREEAISFMFNAMNSLTK